MDTFRLALPTVTVPGQASRLNAYGSSTENALKFLYFRVR
jgi:hypothetical protein